MHALDRDAPIHLVTSTLGHAMSATTGSCAYTRPFDPGARHPAVQEDEVEKTGRHPNHYTLWADPEVLRGRVVGIVPV